MRLVCPNCEARYEVPEENIPFMGREVQCSACWRSWFQTHPHFEKEQVGVAQSFVKQQELVDKSLSGVSSESDESVPRANVSKQRQQKEEPIKPKRRLHPTVTEVLREEARLEQIVRAQERRKSQSDSDIDIRSTNPNENSKELGTTFRNQDSALFDHLNVTEIRKSGVIEKKEVTNAELVPDATTTKNVKFSSKAKGNIKPADEMLRIAFRRRKAKRLGFLTGFLIVGLSVLVYHNALFITQLIEPLSPALSQYVSFIDRVRSISDQWIANLIYWLESQADLA